VAPATVNANSVNRLPVNPPMNATGANTATTTMFIAMMEPASSRPVFRAAFIGESPASTWREAFSTITMASSTTVPMARTSASRVNRLIEKPNINIRNTPPTSDSGIVTAGTKAARSDPRKR